MTLLPNDQYNFPFIEFLLENGADVNRQDKSGRTALLMVCYWGNNDLVDLLLKYKANMDISTYKRVFIFCNL